MTDNKIKNRRKKLLLLVKNVNKKRKKQAKKIDILCNDFITAQRNFIGKLNTISFKADFCESIVAIAKLDNLLYAAGKFVQNEFEDANVSFFIRKTNSFELHLSQSDQPITMQDQQLENCFTNEVVESICKANKICSIENLFEFGLQANPSALGKISAATIPLGRQGTSIGFMLLYHLGENNFTKEDLNNLSAITPALSKAITNCKALADLQIQK
ncbi:MAG: hypothetical protein KAQ89_06725 [Planctomycetes bacterium]|nr:hypothetical protein [Planctomycetota bacterium]